MELLKYKSHKEVHGTPMTRGEYYRYRNWEVPTGENPCDAGYLVIYNKDTDDHYESWSPKKQFEDGYAKI